MSMQRDHTSTYIWRILAYQAMHFCFVSNAIVWKSSHQIGDLILNFQIYGAMQCTIADAENYTAF